MAKKTQYLKPDTVLKNYWNNKEQVISPEELEDANARHGL